MADDDDSEMIPETTPARFDEPKTFEDATARLEGLVRDMESGRMPLEDMIRAFEEGRYLVAFCNAKLIEVQKRVEQVKAGEADGTIRYSALPPRN